jgi:hypothetical protein
MKKLLLISFLFMLCANAFGENNAEAEGLSNKTTYSLENNLPNNYQQFKLSLLNLDLNTKRVPKNNYQRGDDYLMLYVAGGIVVVTAAIVLLNGSSEFEQGLGQADTGLIIGGGVMTALITTKYFVDQTR